MKIEHKDDQRVADAALELAVREGQSPSLAYFLAYFTGLGVLTLGTGLTIWAVAG